MNTTGDFSGEPTNNRFINFYFVKINILDTLIVIQIVGITLVKNGKEILYKLPIDDDFYAIDKRG